MKRALLPCILGGLLGWGQAAGRPQSENSSAATSSKPAEGTAPLDLLSIKRVYVEALNGDGSAEAIRELLISSLERSHLFLVTDNAERADAILRGAANDKDYTDTFDTQNGINGRATLGGIASGLGKSSGVTGGAANVSVGEDDSRHTRERKHEALATVRLCNRDGDVLWATTQESKGAKFRGASADVAEKVIHQLRLDMMKTARERDSVSQDAPPPTTAKP
jgi:hypothetical protein